MKRFLITIMAILLSVQLALGIMTGVFYYSVTEDKVPKPGLSVMDTVVYPVGFNWNEPVLGGVVHRSFSRKAPGEPKNIGKVTQPTLDFALPADYESMSATIYKDDERVWTGTTSELAGRYFLDNGTYRIKIDCKRSNNEKNKGYGTLAYDFSFNLKLDTTCETSSNLITAGDVFAIRLNNLGSSASPRVITDLGDVKMAYSGPGEMTAYIPVSFNTSPGVYPVSVENAGKTWDYMISVQEGSYTSKDLSFDDSDERLQQAISEEAILEFEELIPPLYYQSAGEKKWEGRFILPVDDGAIITRYGTMQHINRSKTPVRHEGVDIGAKLNTEVLAPNDGTVIFAQNLLNTGNTIVIDHGGGLKSYLFHMQRTDVKAGDEVVRGQAIGTVGITGYSTWPHLKYEARIWDEPINPMLIFNGSASMYEFE